MTLLKDKMAGRHLLLASRSPRRRELVAGLGLPYRIAEAYEVDEVWPEELEHERVPEYLAALKADAFPRLLAPEEILLTADTVVLCEGRILGKPADRDDAVRMLGRLSGHRHRVVTGVVLRAADASCGFSVSTDVWFRVLRGEEVEYYVDACAPYDKAGSYGIQEWIGYVGIERIDGSFYNVMGLPVQRLYTELDGFVDSLAAPDRRGA